MRSVVIAAAVGALAGFVEGVQIKATNLSELDQSASLELAQIGSSDDISLSQLGVGYGASIDDDLLFAF